MEQNKSYIELETCKQCLFCGQVCPNLLIEKNDKNNVIFKAEFYDLCITCGHCMAVCPTDSIHIEELKYGKDIIEKKAESTGADFFINLISNRRAVRQYKNKEVEKDKLGKIIEIISKAPVSFTPNSLEITVVRSVDKIKSALPLFVRFYDDLVKMLDKSIPRFFVKSNVDDETFRTLTEDIYPIFKYKLPMIKETEIDPIFRNAPVVFIIHADKKVINHTEDGIIAMTYGILAAHSLGLGSCPVSLIPPAINREKQLKEKFEIPQNNKVISSFVVGYSKYKYKKNIDRKLKNVNYL